MSVLESIRYNLANLFRLAGRESRAQFWPYAIAIFLLGMAADFLLMIPVMMKMMLDFGDYIRAHPEGLPEPAPGQPPLPLELMPDFAQMAVPLAVVSLVTLLLWAAAVVRRLHDRDRSGWWGAIVLPFHLAGAAVLPATMNSAMTFPADPSPLFLLATINSLLFWIALIVLVVMLAGEGTPGPNRFGNPVRA